MRSALYNEEKREDALKNVSSSELGEMIRDVLPEGFGSRPPAPPSAAVAIILWRLYQDQPLPENPISDIPPLKAARNQEIYDRYMAGERAVDLAKEYRISVRRISKLIMRIQRRKTD